MSSDESWWGGEAVFEYIDDPLTNEEYLNKVVTNDDMRLELFKRMHKKMSSNKPSEGQTSDSSGKTGPGKFFYYNYANLASVIVPKTSKTNFANENRMSLAIDSQSFLPKMYFLDIWEIFSLDMSQISSNLLDKAYAT